MINIRVFFDGRYIILTTKVIYDIFNAAGKSFIKTISSTEKDRFQMKFDIVFVTYNSKKWLRGNLESILRSDYDIKTDVSLFYYDNKSSDDTVTELEALKAEYGERFAEFTVIRGKKNKGFGYGCNKAASRGHSEYIFFLNTDTEVKPDTLSGLEKRIMANEDVFSAFELRQEPYEHPKYYEPVTGETSWASGACLVFKRDVFEKIGGFDKNLFMYGEDVEISWRARSRGYKIKYLYDLGIIHYSYSSPGEFKSTAYVYGNVHDLYLRCKYGSLRNSLKGLYLVLKVMRRGPDQDLPQNEHITVKKRIRKAFFKLFFKYIGARIYKHTHRFSYGFSPVFSNLFGYEVFKLNLFRTPCTDHIEKDAKVSVIVRTCGRPAVLRETLKSIRNQSYKNLEVVIVEDGENKSEQMIKNEFCDLNFKYRATGEHVGRCKAGNLALSLATGDYFNFLDDDDLFYFDHVEVLVKEAVNNGYDIVYDTAFEAQVNVTSKDPFVYDVLKLCLMNSGRYSRLKLYSKNMFPIQTVMFSRKVYETCGGFDENMDALEDWELWLRFSEKFDFNFVKDTTSVFKTPAFSGMSAERQKFLDSYISYVLDKHKDDKIELTVPDVFLYINNM